MSSPSFASRWDGRSRALLRVGLAARGGLTLGQLALSLAAQENGPPRALVLLLALFGALGAGLLATARASLRGALALLVALALAAELDAALAGAPHRAWFAVGATLFGWAFGLAYGRGLHVAQGRGPSAAPSAQPRAVPREDLAELGAVAALAATYVAAALEKLLAAGLGWTAPHRLSGLILQLGPVEEPGLRGALARLIVAHPAWCRALLVATLAIELGALALVIGPRLRALAGALLVAFHLQVWALTGIAYQDNVWLLALFCGPWWRFAHPAPLPDTTPPSPAHARRVLALAVALLAAAVALAWLTPLRAFTLAREAGG